MCLKVFERSVALIGLFLTLEITAHVQNVIIDGLTSTRKQVSSGEPIVIHTQLQQYDQPTFREYQECHENLAKCKTVCEGVENPVECVKQCPICPFLIKEEVVVQGINDTDYRTPSSTAHNTTNIIRLTNQIQNIIENMHSNITIRNENVVHIHQNTSRVGGKFGLGYNNTDSCCIILRSSKNCETRKFSTAARCHRKRHRVCGEQCKSRVMLAKRITLCEQSELAGDYEDGTEENCQQTVKYVPYDQDRRSAARRSGKCSYQPYWPFVSCRKGLHNNRYPCDKCQSLPYALILRNGMPPQCRRCFMIDSYSGYGHASYDAYDMYALWYPAFRPMPPPIMDNDFEQGYDFEMGGWKQEKLKCKLPNGAISDNCYDIEGSGSGSDSSSIIYEYEFPPKDAWGDLPEAQDEYDDYDDTGPVVRRRRQTFLRSKYSRRYKQ